MKQIEETQHLLFDGTGLKAINQIRGYDPERSSGVTSVGEAYSAAAYGYRCIHLRANSVSQIPYRVISKKKSVRLMTGWEHEYRLPRLLWLTEAALCLYGAAYWFRSRNLVKTKDYRWLAPQTIRPKYDKEEGITGFRRDLTLKRKSAFEQMLNREETLDSGTPLASGQQEFELADVVYFFLPDPEAEVGPGRPPTFVALEAIGLLKYLNEYASGFFKRGAIPTVLLTVKGQAHEADLKKLENWWKRMASGIQNAWQTVAVRADVEPKIIGQPVKDLGMWQLSDAMRGQIAVSYGVPQTLLEDAANYATAKTHRKSFYIETILPEANLIQGVLNEQVFGPVGQQFEFLPEQMQIMQEEEAERSGALSALVSAGVPLLVAMNILGFYVDDLVLDDLEASLAQPDTSGDPNTIERQRLLISKMRIRQADERIHQAEERIQLQRANNEQDNPQNGMGKQIGDFAAAAREING